MAVLTGDVREGRGARVWRRRAATAPLEDDPAVVAFGRLYEVAVPEVYRYLSGRCGAAAAEDLTQDTFVVAAAAVRRGHDDVTLPWLITIARNKMIDHFRRHEVAARATQLLAPSVPDELVVWRGERSRDEALAALACLPARQRTALVLRYVDDLSVPEVAAALDRSVHATESLLARGRASFKRLYVEGIDD